MAWFRVYDTMVDDPKVQKLSPRLFKALINLWCLANQHGGQLPPRPDIAFKLRLSIEAVESLIASLSRAGLLDVEPAGNKQGTVVPHNWHNRQFKSDVSTERVKKHRNQKLNTTEKRFNGVSPTVSETPPDTDTDTEAEKSNNFFREPNNLISGAGAPPVASEDLKKAPYAFEGMVIKIRRDVYDRWRRTYPRIANFDAELQRIDDYYATHPDKQDHWFYGTSSWLKKSNDEADTRRKEELRRRGSAW